MEVVLPCFRSRFKLGCCLGPSWLGCLSSWEPLSFSRSCLLPEEFGLLAVPEGLALSFSLLLGCPAAGK